MFETSDLVSIKSTILNPCSSKVYFVISTEMGPPVKKLNIQNHNIADIYYSVSARQAL